MQKTINISEIFYSIQGEGLLVGMPSLFIRIAGCPLRCKFCDTDYAHNADSGEKFTIAEIINKVKKYNATYVVITGGEPMVCPDIALLCKEIKDFGCHITIETAGIKSVDNLSCDLMGISPKLSNAYGRPEDRNKYLKIDQMQKLIDSYNYQLKFVIDSKADMAEVEALLQALKNINQSKVLLMPQAKDLNEYIAKSPMVADICRESGFIFSPRLQLVCGFH